MTIFKRDLWNKLPGFMKGHMTVRATLRGSSDEWDAMPWTHQDIDTANLITSKVDRFHYGVEYHRPVLDIDFEAALVPSSTPGHYHLYLDRLMTKTQYFDLLRALAEAGIIQSGFKDAAIERGASSARLPWINKDDWLANQGDPQLSFKQLQEDVVKAEEALMKARAKLDKVAPF